MVQVKVMSSVCARYKALTFFFNSVSVLYSVIYREKNNLPASTSVLFYLFFLFTVVDCGNISNFKITLVSLSVHLCCCVCSILCWPLHTLKILPFPYNFLHLFPSYSLSSPKHPSHCTPSLCLTVPCYCNSSGLYLTFSDYSLSFLLKIAAWQRLQSTHQVF